jgi:metal-responsive CopG/Arc/MetJ family transcriptional regulator
MSDQNRDERLQIMLTEEELSALDDWRFARRMPSRAAAVRELLRRGLAAEGVQLADGKMKSKDFGVTEANEADNVLPLRSRGKHDGAET